jgi:hypothetical protein
MGVHRHPGGPARHQAQPRGKAVVTDLFGTIRPEVWVSDMLGSQKGHAVEWQVCLAHLPRDGKYATEAGETVFSAPFRRLLLRAIAIGHGVTRWRTPRCGNIFTT